MKSLKNYILEGIFDMDSNASNLDVKIIKNWVKSNISKTSGRIKTEKYNDGFKITNVGYTHSIEIDFQNCPPNVIFEFECNTISLHNLADGDLNKIQSLKIIDLAIINSSVSTLKNFPKISKNYIASLTLENCNNLNDISDISHLQIGFLRIYNQKQNSILNASGVSVNDLVLYDTNYNKYHNFKDIGTIHVSTRTQSISGITKVDHAHFTNFTHWETCDIKSLKTVHIWINDKNGLTDIIKNLNKLPKFAEILEIYGNEIDSSADLENEIRVRYAIQKLSFIHRKYIGDEIDDEIDVSNILKRLEDNGFNIYKSIKKKDDSKYYAIFDKNDIVVGVLKTILGKIYFIESKEYKGAPIM